MDTERRTHVRVCEENYKDHLNFAIIEGSRRDEYFYAATKVTMERIKPGDSTPTAFSIPYDCGQILMDDLWNAGIRPTETKNQAGEIAATKYHLEDMRKLVFEQK